MFDFNISEEYRLAPLKILPPKSQQAKPKRFHIKLPVADPAGSQTDLSPTTKIVYSIMEPAKLKLHAYSPMNTLRTEKSLKDLNLPGNLSDRLPTNEYSPLLKNGELRMVPKRHIKDSASQTWRDNQYIQEEFSKAWASNSNFLRSSLPKMNHSQKLSKTTRKQENELSIKRARQEVAALQANLSKAMDRSKEKLIVEELRDFSPERKDIKNAYEEIENLRKLTNSKLTKCERHLAPLNSTERQKTQKNPESPKSSRLYQMGSEDKLDVAYYLSKPAVSAATKLNISSSGLLPEYYDSKAAISTLIGDKNLAEKHQTHDPFDKLILYQNEKMPFSLAVMAKTRHKIFEEVKNRPGNYKEKRKIGYVKDLREKLVPEEKAKFLEQLDESEKQKKYKEMQSKKAQTNAIYQLAAMNKASQMRVKAKMKEQLPVNSRFLTL